MNERLTVRRCTPPPRPRPPRSVQAPPRRTMRLMRHRQPALAPSPLPTATARSARQKLLSVSFQRLPFSGLCGSPADILRQIAFPMTIIRRPPTGAVSDRSGYQRRFCRCPRDQSQLKASVCSKCDLRENRIFESVTGGWRFHIGLATPREEAWQCRATPPKCHRLCRILARSRHRPICRESIANARNPQRNSLRVSRPEESYRIISTAHGGPLRPCRNPDTHRRIHRGWSRSNIASKTDL